MKTIRCIAALLFALPALAKDDPQADLYNFLVGGYQIVGKGLDSSAAYQGAATIALAGDHVEISKQIGDRQVTGTGRIENALMADVRVLKIRLREADTDYEQTCLFQGDLDNFARITCHLYRPNVATETPGLEAWFIRRPATDAAGLVDRKGSTP